MFRSSPNTDGFYTFYISQGSVATQLRCRGMFNNHFTTNFSQNAAVKNFWKSVKIWQRYRQNFVAYFFGPPCTLTHNNNNCLVPAIIPQNILATKLFQCFLLIECSVVRFNSIVVRTFGVCDFASRPCSRPSVTSNFSPCKKEQWPQREIILFWNILCRPNRRLLTTRSGLHGGRM